jgi:hypothetical protein
VSDTAQLYCNAGVSLARAQRYEDAEAAFRAALCEEPSHAHARWGLAHALLGQGRYLEGWPLLRARFEILPGYFRPASAQRPEWRGESLAGKRLLVMFEQGFGDQIMLARFLAPVRAAGAEVVLATRRALARLLAPCADEIVPIEPGGQAIVPTYDHWTHLFTLPERLGATLETLPAGPYLTAAAGRRAGGVGLFWRTEDARRSLPEELARRLLDAGLVSLHPEDTGATDFAETAALIARLDLVVSIDTAAAHVAGALGRPVWILLPSHGVDWRWMRERADSPWYPSARLFRQGPDRSWAPVVAAVEAALTQGAGDRASA